ncbi:MAG TPA: NAD(+) synthase, partial [Nevskiaceae bacterium]|nr:NAD(+) synthase [Nevskiaceae bacterium]
CEGHSARCLAAYAYSAAGVGESTTDLAWDGQALICENGTTLAAAERFSGRSTLTVADVDLDRLRQERMRMTSWRDQAGAERERLQRFRRIPFRFEVPVLRTLAREVARFPYVPADASTRDARCAEIFSIQVQGLERRMAHTSGKGLVIGVSGGLDSTLALLVCAATVDRLKLPRSRILGFTMPGFATSDRTKHDAHALMRALGTSAEEIDIRPSCRQMLADLGHPFARGEEVYDITFENVQAGERTSHLFRLANHRGGFVVGTGDLSELALGWCTYGVGDQMAHYNVNASIPKTLVRYLVAWAAHTDRFGEATAEVLDRILETTISPELVPEKAGKTQATEESVGPYDLQDFTLYYLTRFGYRPEKIAFLAWHAWHDVGKGTWPDLVPARDRKAYDLDTIVHWQKVFLDRFVRRSQYKRSAMPNGPKVGSGGSLSPRGDWRAPSDASSAAWLESLERAFRAKS